MAGDEIGRLMYLVLLGAAVLAWFIAQNRNSLGKTMQHAAVWGLIFVGVIAAVGLWGDIRKDVLPQQNVIGNGEVVEVPRAIDGHYYLTLMLEGEPVRFAVDTGATTMVLSPDDAKKIGLDPNDLAYLGQAQTANGVVRTAKVVLDEVRLGNITDRNVVAYVNEAPMDGSLLGMSYLGEFDRIEITGDNLILTR